MYDLRTIVRMNEAEEKAAKSKDKEAKNDPARCPRGTSARVFTGRKTVHAA